MKLQVRTTVERSRSFAGRGLPPGRFLYLIRFLRLSFAGSPISNDFSAATDSHANHLFNRGDRHDRNKRNYNQRPAGRAAKAEEEEERLFGFRTAHVFDISQTAGKDLLAFAEVHGNPGEHLTRLHTALADSGIELRYSNHLGSAMGLSRGSCIEVKQGLTEAEEFAVLVHEWAHEILHHQKGVENISKTILETETEAVSYVVCKAVGLDTNTASSDYIQLYNGNKETLMESLERIKEASGRI